MSFQTISPCKTYRKKRVAYRLVFPCYLKKYSLLCLILIQEKMIIQETDLKNEAQMGAKPVDYKKKI